MPSSKRTGEDGEATAGQCRTSADIAKAFRLTIEQAARRRKVVVLGAPARRATAAK